MRDRKNVDWDKEVEKTERIRSRGLKLSILSFLFAVTSIGGIKFYADDFKTGPLVLIISLSFLIVMIGCVFLAKRAKKERKR